MHWSGKIAVVLLAGAAACTEPTATAPEIEAAYAGNGTAIEQSANPIDYAVIGDVPYGAAATVRWPDLIDAINDDPKVRRTVHIGDIKNGSTVCSVCTSIRAHPTCSPGHRSSCTEPVRSRLVPRAAPAPSPSALPPSSSTARLPAGRVV